MQKQFENGKPAEDEVADAEPADALDGNLLVNQAHGVILNQDMAAGVQQPANEQAENAMAQILQGIHMEVNQSMQISNAAVEQIQATRNRARQQEQVPEEDRVNQVVREVGLLVAREKERTTVMQHAEAQKEHDQQTPSTSSSTGDPKIN